MVNYKTSESQNELEQILELQSINLQENISESEKQQQGFVTVEHDLDLLGRMNQKYQHIIAKDGEKLIGYALVMLPEFADEIVVLQPMFDEFNSIKYHGKTLRETPYFVMGQVCVAKDYRSKGVFAGLYNHMKTMMSPHFACIVTEISSRNKRSIRAHEKVGFTTEHIYRDNNDEWQVVIWDWSS